MTFTTVEMFTTHDEPCRIEFVDSAGWTGDQRRAAHALVAAAPGLLAALKQTERELSAWHYWRAQQPGYTESDGYRETAGILRTARDAINRAERV